MEDKRVERLAQKVCDALFEEGYRVSKMTFVGAKHFVRDFEILTPSENIQE